MLRPTFWKRFAGKLAGSLTSTPAAPPVAAAFRTRAVAGQVERIRDRAILVEPVGGIRGKFRRPVHLRFPLLVLVERHRRGQFIRAPLASCGIGGREFEEKNVARPSVAHEVMRVKDEGMLLLAEADQLDANQWPAL